MKLNKHEYQCIDFQNSEHILCFTLHHYKLALGDFMILVTPLNKRVQKGLRHLTKTY